MSARNAMITAMILMMQIAGPVRVSAVLLVEETFDYAAGTAVNGLNGGTGWGGAWGNADNPWSVTSPGLTVAGVGIASPDNCIKGGATSANRTASRNFSSAYTNGIVYLGAVLSNHGGTSHYGYLAVVNSYNYGFKVGWANGNWNLSGCTGSNTWGPASDSGVPVVFGEPVLAVLKIDIDNKTGYLYINQATEGTPACSATGSRFGMLTLSTRCSASGTSSVDDVRVGTTYADVAAIPIPKMTVVTIRGRRSGRAHSGNGTRKPWPSGRSSDNHADQRGRRRCHASFRTAAGGVPARHNRVGA